jgi:hypothetical protein
MPMATQLTRMRCGAHSTLKDLLRWISPARAATVWGTPALHMPGTATMLMMQPGWSWSRHCRAAACIMYQDPVRLVSMTAFQPLGVMSSAGAANWPPALLTRTSSFP